MAERPIRPLQFTDARSARSLSLPKRLPPQYAQAGLTDWFNSYVRNAIFSDSPSAKEYRRAFDRVPSFGPLHKAIHRQLQESSALRIKPRGSNHQTTPPLLSFEEILEAEQCAEYLGLSPRYCAQMQESDTDLRVSQLVRGRESNQPSPRISVDAAVLYGGHDPFTNWDTYRDSSDSEPDTDTDSLDIPRLGMATRPFSMFSPPSTSSKPSPIRQSPGEGASASPSPSAGTHSREERLTECEECALARLSEGASSPLHITLDDSEGVKCDAEESTPHAQSPKSENVTRIAEALCSHTSHNRPSLNSIEEEHSPTTYQSATSAAEESSPKSRTPRHSHRKSASANILLRPALDSNEPYAAPILTYAELTAPNVPSFVDCRHKEDYLSDAEFQKLFRMTREEFRNLATWRQQLRKRDLRLF